MSLYASKAAAKREIQALIDRNDKAVMRAISAIYAYQTADEQSAGMTCHSNGVGFSGCDAEVMTSFAQQIESKGWLSPKQIMLGRRIIRKYWRQLADIAEAKASAARAG